ncbi:SRPBCC family protein [Levilactobacillus yiduensis]|uniref:SRPBCC family protein n=1 Tax=Levilactobacillus yiduensis TaxID=2953880 RepID=UPI000EF34779|nr:SRPBCC family protein [Levilactobacillus yiduensis]AYM03281.1 SRPBCC family protein [Levilactobacillus brevis]
MNTPLFQNTLYTTLTPTQVRTRLLDLTDLPRWNPAITQVTPTETGVHLTRQQPALNLSEDVTVTATASQVDYHSTGDRLTYTLTFTLTVMTTGTQITETLTVIEPTALTIPLRLLAPVAQAAFARNLALLVAQDTPQEVK